MSDELKIGVTSDSNGRGSFNKTNWFKIPQDSTVLFRVLPPLHSLAERGVYAKYHSVHYGFKDSKGTVRPFACVEEKNKDKFITRHCAVCDMVSELDGKLNMLETQGNHDKAQLKAFRENNIQPFKASKKYFLNAIDANGDIGLLVLGYKAFQQLERIRKELKDKGQDLTGIKGTFIEIARSGYGFDTLYQVSLSQEAVNMNGETVYRRKQHELTPEIMQSMKTKTRDLSTLFKTIDDESIAALVSVTGTDRAALVDKIFASSEQAPSQQSGSSLSSTDLSLGVEAVGRVSLAKGEIILEKPFLEDVKRTAEPVNNTAGKAIATSTDEALAAFMNNRQATAPAPAKAAPAPIPSFQGNKTMSDDEFLKTFGKIK